MGKDTRARKWQVTINNPSEKGLDHEAIRAILGTMEGILYWCMCDEIGKKETYHTHIFLMGRNQIRFSTIQKKFPGGHFEMCQGTAQQNRDYIRKEGKWEKERKKETNLGDTFEEEGECPQEEPGKRTDLETLKEMIKEGMTDCDIIEAAPQYMFQMDKIGRVRQIQLEAKYKKDFRKLHVEYRYGETGVGKTRGVMEQYGYEKVYRVTDYQHPFDNYAQQPVIVFEEFWHSLPIRDMLNYLDGYPLSLPCRYSNKIACYDKVYIISNVPVIEQYPNVQESQPEVWRAFLRRIHVFNRVEKGCLGVVEGVPF